MIEIIRSADVANTADIIDNANGRADFMATMIARSEAVVAYTPKHAYRGTK